MDTTTGFVYGYRVLQLFCHNVEEAHDVKCNKKIAGTDVLLILETWF